MSNAPHDPSDRWFSPRPAGTTAKPLGDEPTGVTDRGDPVDLGRRRSFELESHGGYLRNVTGTIEYLDGGAQTYFVRGDDGGMLRVPIRDITSVTWAGALGGVR
jgi:hypothetical protein